MKKSIALGVMCVALSTAQAAPTLSVGVIKESVTEPVKVDVNIYSVSGSYRFDSGMYAGVTLQKAYSTIDENRTEGFVGFGTKLGSFAPYAEVTIGRRDFDSTVRQDFNYAAVSTGVRYHFSDRVYSNLRYRYRDSYDTATSWKTNSYSVGLGYNINKTTTIEGGYAYTDGDYTSDALAVFLVNRF